MKPNAKLRTKRRTCGKAIKPEIGQLTLTGQDAYKICEDCKALHSFELCDQYQKSGRCRLQ